MQPGQKLIISSKAAALLQADTSREEKLKAARREIPLAPHDLIVVLLYLNRDPDQDVKKCSLRSLQSLEEDVIAAVCAKQDAHPRILDALARLHSSNQRIAGLIAGHPNLGENTLAFLAESVVKAATDISEMRNPDIPVPANSEQTSTTTEMTLPSEEEQPEADEDEFRSKFQLAQELGVTEKIKLALTGDKEWRSLLIRDNNKIVSEAVLKNPRITEQEILLICKSSVKSDDIIRTISSNKEWTKNHSIRKALIENHRTPLHFSLRFLTFLSEKELSFLTKNKNVASVLTTQARRMLNNKKSGN